MGQYQNFSRFKPSRRRKRKKRKEGRKEKGEKNGKKKRKTIPFFSLSLTSNLPWLCCSVVCYVMHLGFVVLVFVLFTED